jgi:hypothetical protein
VSFTNIFCNISEIWFPFTVFYWALRIKSVQRLIFEIHVSRIFVLWCFIRCACVLVNEYILLFAVPFYGTREHWVGYRVNAMPNESCVLITMLECNEIRDGGVLLGIFLYSRVFSQFGGFLICFSTCGRTRWTSDHFVARPVPAQDNRISKHQRQSPIL